MRSAWLSEQQSQRLREEPSAVSSSLLDAEMLNRLRLLMSLQREWWQGCLCSYCSLAAPNEDLPLCLHREC